MSKKLLFLDIDGVLNSWHYFKNNKTLIDKSESKKDFKINKWTHLDPDAIKRLNRLVDLSGVEVIISSTWRLLFSLEEINKMLAFRGATFQASNRTPEGYYRGMSSRTCRGDEIKEFIDNFSEPVDAFVILDDDNDMDGVSSQLVQTSMNNGIQDYHIDLCLDKLGIKI